MIAIAGSHRWQVGCLVRQSRHYLARISTAVLAASVLAGCASTEVPPDDRLQARAELCLRRGIRYPENPAIRAQATEAAADVLGRAEILLIREGLKDEHPGVRFAACMSLGDLGDHDSMAPIRALAGDPDGSVRVGAYYALERLGDPSYRREWGAALRDDPSPVVRRNAALALGMLGDEKTKRLLAKAAVEDRDEGVRLQALEALAVLGDEDAEARFIRDAFGGIGFHQPFALLTLGRLSSDRMISALRARLQTAPYLEAKLAAARGLGRHGYDDGYDLALKSLTWNQPDPALPDDPPMNQIMRVRSMAALALGDIGVRQALPDLNRVMEKSDDPRIQLAAACAILKILRDTPPSVP